MFETIEGYGGVGTFRCGEYISWDNDILVTINFTSLPVASIETAHQHWQSALVMLSFTNDTRKTVIHTRPSRLAPGIDLIGISQSHIRQTFKSRALSVFGFFDVRSKTRFNLQTR